jgi:hypothetical protein
MGNNKSWLLKNIEMRKVNCLMVKFWFATTFLLLGLNIYVVGQITEATGSFCVVYFFPESSLNAPNHQENWTTERVNIATHQLNIGMQWWMAKSPDHANLDISFARFLPSDLIIDHEPITISTNNIGSWIHAIMSKIGHGNIFQNHMTRVQSFNDWYADEIGVSKVWSVFVVDSNNDPDHSFPCGSSAFAHLGGPYFVVTWGNGGWINEFPDNNHMQWVGAHETGHIFQAFDQYPNPLNNPNYPWNNCDLTYNGFFNENSAECPSGGYVSSIMKGDPASYPPLSVQGTNIDYWVQGMIGWEPSVPQIIGHHYDAQNKIIKIDLSTDEADLSFANNSSIIVNGSQSGSMNCYFYLLGGYTLAIQPYFDFLPNETISVIINSGFRAKSGINFDGNGDGFPGPDYSFFFQVPDFNLPQLLNGSVTPTSGSNSDTYTFSVTYTGSTAPTSNSIKVVVDGVEHVMSPNGSNWSNGVVFTKSLSGFSVGQHSYYFIGSAGGQNLRFPATGQFYFNVSQSTEGWDARVTSVSSNTNSFSGSYNLRGYGTVQNASNPGNTYYNLPIKFEFFDPAGNKIHEESGYVPSIAPGVSLDYHSQFVSISSSAPDGNYQIRFSVSPLIDSDWTNNSRSTFVYKGESGNIDQYHILENDALIMMNNGDIKNFAGNSYQFRGVSLSNERAVFTPPGQSNPVYSINYMDFIELDNYNTIISFYAYLSSSQAMFSFGQRNHGIISYENTGLNAFPGETIEFVANTQGNTFAQTSPDFYWDTKNVSNWYHSMQRFNNNQSVRFVFNIPSDAEPGDKRFYLGARLNAGNEHVMSGLRIRVLQPPPNIVSLSSYSISAGDEITITGTDFGTTQGQVKFNDLNGQVSSWTNNSITCIVPSGVQSGILTVVRGSTVSNGMTYQVVCQISLTANPADGGFVFGSGDYIYGSNVEVNATSNTGYTFNSWTEDGQVVSSNATYQFTATANRNLVANFSQTSYTIAATANPPAGGTITGAGNYNHGASVTLVATPNTGYTFTNWTENGQVVSSNATYQFTATANRNLVANFSQTSYTITATANPTAGGSITGAGNYNHGATVTLVATPNTGYTFTNWTENGQQVSTNATYQFTATANRNLVANFSQTSYTIAATANPLAGGTITGTGNYNHGATVTLVATPNTGYTFTNWTENGQQVSTNATYQFTATTNRSLVANFSLNAYTISAVANPTAGGSITGNGNYNHGANVTLVATPSAGYAFTNWTENGQQVSTNATYQFTATANRNLVANFSPNAYTISAVANPTAGGSITGNGNYNHGANVTLVATPSAGYAFSNWTENGQQVSTNATYQFTATANRNLVANFSQTSYTIAATANPLAGGAITGAGNYNHGATVTLVATPNTGYTFTNWTENGQQVSTNATYQFTATANRNLVANFSQTSYTISATANPTAGGSITGAGNYNHGATVTLVATANTGYTFTNWTENGQVVSSNAIYQFTATANRNLVANFTLNTYTISAVANPTAGGSITGAGNYNHGASVSLVATPNTGYTFVNWTENGQQVSSNATYQFTATANRNLVANFSPTSYTIAATANPTAGGTITGAGNYNHGATVNLVATPNICYVFVNWTENGQVISTNPTYQFTATTNRNLVANFTQSGYSILAVVNPPEGGYIIGAGFYGCGASVTLTAGPNAGYTFTNWTENGQVVSSNATYQFTATANRNLVANFTLNSYTISAVPNPTAGGSITGAGNYNHGATVTLAATANTGYSFTIWTENGQQVSTNATYQFTATANRNLVANFTLNTYTISSVANPTAGGSITGAGSYNHGATVTLIATANTGYTFLNWTENGQVVSSNANYQFTATANRNLVANFTLNAYTISAVSNPTAGGSISGDGNYNHGASVSLVATPNSGYTYTNWTETVKWSPVMQPTSSRQQQTATWWQISHIVHLQYLPLQIQ